MAGVFMESRKEALRCLEEAQQTSDPIQIGAAAVYALLEIADVIKHGLRDVIYELRD